MLRDILDSGSNYVYHMLIFPKNSVFNFSKSVVASDISHEKRTYVDDILTNSQCISKGHCFDKEDLNGQQKCYYKRSKNICLRHVIICFRFKYQSFNVFNPLSANVEYTRHETVVTSAITSDTIKIMKKLTFKCKSYTKWYRKTCALVDPFLRNCVKVKFSI